MKFMHQRTAPRQSRARTAASVTPTLIIKNDPPPHPCRGAAALPEAVMNNEITTFTMGELWAGANGMRCEEPGCRKRSFAVFLAAEDRGLLGDKEGPYAAIQINRDSLGRVWCDTHAPAFTVPSPPWQTPSPPASSPASSSQARPCPLP